MTGLRSPWLLAVAPAMVLLVPVFAPFISLQHRFLYHQDGSAVTVLLALWLNLFAAWLVFVALFSFAARSRTLALLFVAVSLTCLPVLLLGDWAALNYTAVSPAAHRAALAAGVLLLVLAIVAWPKLLRPRLTLVHSQAASLLGLLSLSWLVTLGQLALYTLEARALDRTPPLHRAVQPSAASALATSARPRVIWIIFDELGYDPVFAHRLPGVALPAFDALAAQSTQFTQAQAPGLYTEYVIPEIVMGHSAERIAFTSTGAFTYRDAAARRSLHPEDTVFGDALRAGYSTAVVGWHNPYCRLLAPVLDQCFWTARANSFTPDFDARAPLLTNLLGPARHAWNKRHLRGDFLAIADRREAEHHVDDLTSLLAAADAVLTDPGRNFLLLHLPIPHPLGIYDRQRSTLTTDPGHSYVDNLVLADKVLAHLRQRLTATGEWDRSTVLVMGDHSWRTAVHWEALRGWTAEDQLASGGGGYDPRPAYLLKLPGQHSPATWDRSFPTLETRALLAAVLAGDVRDTGTLQRWALAHP